MIQRYAGGQWRSASGPASGGERALVVSVPLFAAASAHDKSAGNPEAMGHHRVRVEEELQEVQVDQVSPD